MSFHVKPNNTVILNPTSPFSLRRGRRLVTCGSVALAKGQESLYRFSTIYGILRTPASAPDGRLRMTGRVFQILLFFIAACLFLAPKTVLAASNNAFVSIVNPVRGDEYWNSRDQEPTTSITESYKIIQANALPATWLLRYDALHDQKIVTTVKSFNSQQETGLFLEITGSLAQAAGVLYHHNTTWHEAESVFLTGYTPEERLKLIDAAVTKFQEVFGSAPKSVGAWWIDAYSLSYLKEKYGITNAMIVADQYSTDNYQIWGQYWSQPYYPSKVNTLMPAESDDRKLDVVITQWATRDPYNAYGNGVFDSTYSVQANDYVPYHNLDISYFINLLGIYTSPPPGQIGHVIVGLENDFSWSKFGAEYKRQLETLAQKAKDRQLTLTTLSNFANQFHTLNGPDNKTALITAKNPFGGAGYVAWYMSPYYRAGWFYTDKGSVIRDMRLYFDHKEEICLKTPCKAINFAYSDTKALDEVTFGDSWLIDEGEISDISIQKSQDKVTIRYKNKIGNTREIVFSPHDVAVDGKTQAASEAIIKAVDANQTTKGQKIPAPNEPFTAPWGRLLGGGLLFVIACLGLFYLPGRLFRRYFAPQNTSPYIFAVDIAIGIALFTILSYVFGLVHFRIGVLIAQVVLAGLSLWLMRSQLWSFLSPLRTRGSQTPAEVSDRVGNDRIVRVLPVLLVVVGSLVISLSVVKSGWPSNFGIGFWGPNGHDAVWHLSLVEALKKSVPPENFTYAGTTLTNYHYFFDLFVAQLATVTKINTLDLLFRFVPVLLALLYGFLTYIVCFRISSSRFAADLAVFFAYFGGSFGWIVTYFRGQGFGGESMFWSIQSMSFLLNPPFIISAVLLLTGAYLLYDWFSTHNLKLVVPLILLLGFIAEYKAYAAVIVLGGLFLAALYDLIRNKNFKTFILFGLLAVTNVGILLLNTKSASGLLFFSPLWVIHTMVDSHDRLFWERLTLARQSGSPVKFVLAEAIGIAIFIIGNLGTRIIGTWQYLRFRSILRSNGLLLLLLTAAEVGVILPLLFIQKGTAWNTVQFFYYTLIFFNIFAAITLAQLLLRFARPIKAAILTVVVLLTIPTTYALFQTYLPHRAPARLPFAEQKALEFLRQQPDGTVLTYPYYEKVNLKYEEPLPLYAYTTTAYVSAFSGKPVYFEDKMNNEIIGVDTEKRLVGQQEIFKNTNPDFAMKFLRDNHITYIYLPRLLKTHIDEGTYGVKNIYHTDDVNIYKVE